MSKLVNKSGIHPVGISILIKPDEVEDTTDSGIIIHTLEHHQREELGQTDGVVYEIGEAAYYDEKHPRCKVGDRVVIAKYSGMVRKGNDGATYRLVKDNDVLALLENKEKK